MEQKFEKEDEIFGPANSWRLLSRSVVDGQRTTVRGLAVQGKGVMVQTSRQEPNGDDAWHPAEFDVAMLVENVLIMEYMTVDVSEIVDENQNPTSITRKIVGRELVAVAMAREKFQPKKGKTKTNGNGGQFDHLDIRSGVILTLETGGQPRPPAGMVPGAAAQPPGIV